jgi:hypothetical protein
MKVPPPNSITLGTKLVIDETLGNKDGPNHVPRRIKNSLEQGKNSLLSVLALSEKN